MSAACISANQRLAIGGFPRRAEFLRMLAASIPLSERIWRAGIYVTRLFIGLCRPRPLSCISQVLSPPGWRRWLAHDNSSPLFRAHSRSCARRYSLARTISGQRRQRRTQRPRSVEGVHGPWMLSGRSSRCFWHQWPRLNRAQQRHNFFFLLLLTETRHQRTLCGGPLRYGHAMKQKLVE